MQAIRDCFFAHTLLASRPRPPQWHASHGFLLLESVCCAIFFLKRRLQLHRDNKAATLPNPQNFAFIDVLALGAFWSGVLSLTMASFIACEGASYKLGKRRWMHPWIINGLTFGAPLVMGASLVTPIVLSRRAMSGAVKSYKVLVAMDSHATTTDLIAQTSHLWSLVRQSVFHLGVCYAIFAAFELVLLFGLGAAAYKLVRLQREQVLMAQNRLELQLADRPYTLRRDSSKAITPLRDTPPAAADESQRLSNRRRQLIMTASFFGALFVGECLFISLSLYHALAAQRSYARGPKEGTRVVILIDLAVGWSMVVLAALTFAVSALRVLSVVEKTDSSKSRQSQSGSAEGAGMTATTPMPNSPSPMWQVPHLSKRIEIVEIRIEGEEKERKVKRPPFLRQGAFV